MSLLFETPASDQADEALIREKAAQLASKLRLNIGGTTMPGFPEETALPNEIAQNRDDGV
ncbi:MAG: hypothetical protein JOY71_13775 [Acetobacteraceae bacterium]|nr:hypothetical protein [Acetobacteraceae bacterium]